VSNDHSPTIQPEPRLLLLETSGRIGQVALARGNGLKRARQLDEARRHARDLAPAVAELLAAENWKPRDLDAVVVSKGPGSYTGLRVGIMSAKAFAYATGCTLVAVDTLAAVALQAPAEASPLHVLADAQQDKVYVQRFARDTPRDFPRPVSPLAIREFTEWLDTLEGKTWVSGPGLRGKAPRLRPGIQIVPAELWDPRVEGLLRIGLDRYRKGEHEDVWSLEPLYLRPSSAEAKWREKTGP
jgi:tRNA threonylcarbamoyladenosine biosynthesis protein TsaB